METLISSSSSGMQECYANTDLEWRLRQIPDGAACRGVFFNMLDDRAGEFGALVQREYREFFKLFKFSALRLYPVQDYLNRLVKLAQIQFGAANIYKGIFEIQAGAFPAWRQTLIGRAAFGILGGDFEAILRMSNINMAKAYNYGRFTSRRDGEYYVSRFETQYVYIEHAMAGALWGIARACQIDLDLNIRMENPFTGEHRFRLVPKGTVTRRRQ